MLVIGITGPTGCGKTTLLQAVQQRGGYIVDCDALYYELLASEEGADLRRELQTAFPAAFDADGRLRRKALGRLVFGDPSRMAQLNEIVFFHVGNAVRARLVHEQSAGRQLFAIDAINLFESGLAALCDTTVGVLAGRETRIARIMARDGLTREYAALRVDAQKPDSFYKDHCTTILQNAGTRESFARAADQYLTNTVKGDFPMTKQEREALLYQPKHGRDRLSKADEAAMQTYCEAYKAFLDRSKTERECVVSAVELAEQAGFRALQDGMALKPGDKVYSVNRGKSILLAVIGSKSLAEGANIDEMLIVTFTRAAASELRAKLARRLMEASGALEEQSVRLERATITTIHGFCAELLRAHFESAGVSAGFRVLDEANARRMEDEALDEALEEAYAAFDGDLDALDFGRGPKKVRAMAQDLLRALDARPDPQAWIDRSVGEDWQPLFDVLAQAACASLEEARDRTDEAHSLVLGSLPGYEEALAYDMAALYGIPEDADYAHLHKALRDFRQERLKPSRGKDEFGVREFVKLLREEAKRAVQRAQSLVALSEEDARADMKANRPALRALARLAQRAQALLDEKKAEEGALSYGDLERYALRALRVEECARAARERWKWIFVDEYQDTSEIQEAILSALVGQGNAFFVGDVKQSIYRFRMAEPELFLRRQARYARGEGGRLIALTANFRSSDGIVDFVNAVFERALRGGADEIAYTGDERLRAARAFAGERVELHILSPEKDIHETGADEEEESEAELLSGAQAEAQWIAGRIHSLMEADPTLRYRDIAVLTRVKQNVLAPMARVLADEGIPVYADEAGGYTDAFEVRLALALLKLVDNHLDDLSLLAVLRSPLVGLSSRELAQLRLAAGDAPLYEAVLHSQDPALAAFARQLDAWRDRSRRLPLGQFVDSLLSDIAVGSLHEFVAADTEILLAGSSADAGAGKQSGGGIYQIIALAVTEAVVYVFQSVQVGHYQQEVLPRLPRLGYHLWKHGVETVSVEKSGH